MRTIEQHQSIPYSDKLTSPKGKLVTGIMNVLNPLFVRPAVENILIKTDVTYAADFGDQYIRAIEDGYTRPVIIGNHKAIIDAIFPGDAARDLKNVANEHLPPDNQLQGFALILAASLHYGQQGPMRTGVYNGVSDSFEKRSIRPLLTVRPQDVKRYSMKSYWDPRQEKQDAIDAIKSGYGIIVYPEGTTVGETMNSFMLNAIWAAISAVEEAGEKALLIPVTKTGGRKIERRNKLPTFTAIASGINLYNRHITGVYVHNPIRFDQGGIGVDYRNGNKTGINNFIGGIIATHLPPDEQGAYRGRL